MKRAHLISLVEKSIIDVQSEDFVVKIESGRISRATFWISDDGQNLGSITLESTFDFFQSFENVNDENKHFGIFYKVKYEPPDRESPNYATDLTSEEFLKFMRIFKKRMKQEDESLEALRFEDAAPIFEQLSDKYHLDFCPKKRNILTEKIKK